MPVFVCGDTTERAKTMIEYASDVKRWGGKIWLPDYMSFPCLVDWEQALDGAKQLKAKDGLFAFYAKLLPAAIPLVEKWELNGLPNPVTYETFPASPKLVAWLVECITDLYTKTNESDPNSQGG